MKALMIAVVAWLAASAAQAQAQPTACPSLPGVEALWAKPLTRFVIFGEYHGTAETPALFADAVCHASAARPVIVALETQSDSQPAFDAYLASEDRLSPARPFSRREPGRAASVAGGARPSWP